MPPNVRRMWIRAESMEVELELLAFAAARRGDWLTFADFRKAVDKHDIGACLGHVLGRIARAGGLEEKTIYLGTGIGAEQPESPNYQGFTHHWRAAP